MIANQELEANEEIVKKVTLHRGDITAQSVQAILAPYPFRQRSKSLLETAVRQAAGEEYHDTVTDLMDEQKPGFCTAVDAGGLPCDFVLACLTPKWNGGFMGEDRALLNCYENAILEAMSQGFRSVAVPIFLTGNHGYPKPRAVRLCVKAILKAAKPEAFDEIRFVAFKEDIYGLFLDRLERYGWAAPLQD